MRTTSRTCNLSGLRKQPTFRDVTLCFPKNWHLGNEHRNSVPMTCHYSDLGSAADWSCRAGNLLQPIVEKHYLNQGGDTSPVWNFCAPSSDVISWWSQQWCREMSAFFSGYKLSKLLQFGQNARELERFRVTFTAKGGKVRCRLRIFQILEINS